MIPPSADADLETRMQYGVLYSAGDDGSVRVWGLPEKGLVPYSKYGINQVTSFFYSLDYRKHAIAKLIGHTDVVWDLSLHPVRPLVASSSADGTVRIWDMNTLISGAGEDGLGLIEGDLALKVTLKFNGAQGICVVMVLSIHPLENVIPTSVDFLSADLNKILVSFNNSQLQLFDIETGKAVVETFRGAATTYNNNIQTQINRVVAHPIMPVAVTAHEDRNIRFFDTRSGECNHSMVAHLDSVSALDISPNGLVLVSGGMLMVILLISVTPIGHDSSVRLWDFGSHACLQEFSSHRKKYDEAIHSVRFHRRNVPSSSTVSGGSPWLATSGADSCVKIYNCA